MILRAAESHLSNARQRNNAKGAEVKGSEDDESEEEESEESEYEVEETVDFDEDGLFFDVALGRRVPDHVQVVVSHKLEAPVQSVLSGAYEPTLPPPTAAVRAAKRKAAAAEARQAAKEQVCVAHSCPVSLFA